MSLYVGYIDNQPVVTGILVQDANIACLYFIASVPEQRNKGYGTAMVEHLLSLAKQKGYKWAGLEASHEGKRLYKRLGFQEICVFEEYAALPS